jgi:hypothetical protein
MNDRLEGFLSRLPCCRTQALHQDRLVAGWSVIAARRRLEYFGRRLRLELVCWVFSWGRCS